MKILIVEDQKNLSESISEFLNSNDYLCEQAFNRRDALVKVAIYDYDCILLDLMLPDGSGLDVLRRIKERHSDTGVIIISAKDSVDDKVKGLEIGADDYLAKPFNLSELKMRIFALLRRRHFNNNNIIQSNDVTIELTGKEVFANGHKLELTKSEYELLLFFIGNKNKVISKNAIAEHLSGDMADMMDNFNFIYAHIKNLKMKLAAAGCKDDIKTLYGTGYKWVE